MTTEVRGRPTSHDVARLAGLSRSTVSQVLNGGGGFPDDTRRRVLDAAAALDYRPSRAGRTLKRGLDDLVLVLLQNVTYGHDMQDTLDHVAAVASDAGMSTLVRFAGGSTADSVVDTLRDMRPRTVLDFGVLGEAERAALRATGTRVFSPGEHSPGALEAFDVRIGRAQGTELLRAGPRRLVYAMLDDQRTDLFGPGRARGVDWVAAERRLPPADRVRVPLDEDGAVAALEPYLSLDEPIGVACYNDDVAIAVVAAARRSSRVVPHDVAVIGVDHSRLGQLVQPRLSSIEVRIDDLLPQIRATIAGAAGAEAGSDLEISVLLHRGQST